MPWYRVYYWREVSWYKDIKARNKVSAEEKMSGLIAGFEKVRPPLSPKPRLRGWKVDDVIEGAEIDLAE